MEGVPAKILGRARNQEFPKGTWVDPYRFTHQLEGRCTHQLEGP